MLSNIRDITLITITALSLSTAGHAFSATMNGFDLNPASIPVNEIMSGGPPRDGIPAIDQPHFIAADKANFLDDNDRILGLEYRGITKAYPVRILNWHEIVNDHFSGQSIIISFCPLCGSGTAFKTQTVGHEAFGVSGLLYNSDLLLYDRRTHSLWSQILARAISGKRIGEAMQLLPIAHTTWADWRHRHPKTLVLSTNTGYHRNYKRSPYAGYETSNGVFFPIKHMDRRYHPKETVLGIHINGHDKAYPFSELSRTNGQILDRVGDKDIIITFDPVHRTAQARDLRQQPLPGLTAFWFAWMAFHPDSAVFTAP